MRILKYVKQKFHRRFCSRATEINLRGSAALRAALSVCVRALLLIESMPTWCEREPQLFDHNDSLPVSPWTRVSIHLPRLPYNTRIKRGHHAGGGYGVKKKAL